METGLHAIFSDQMLFYFVFVFCFKIDFYLCLRRLTKMVVRYLFPFSFCCG